MAANCWRHAMKKFWSVIELGPRSAAAVAWRREMGEGFASLLHRFVKRTDEIAGGVPCLAACECACAHEVVRYRDGSGFVGICRCEDTGCDDQKLTAEDVRVWNLDPQALARAIGRAWKLEPAGHRLSLPRTVEVGSFGGAALTVGLILARSQADFDAAVASLVARLRDGLIVIAPTAQFHHAGIREMLAGARAGFFDLATEMTVQPGGEFVAHRSAGELFSKFLPAQNEATRADAARLMFALRSKLRDAGKGKSAPHNDVFDLVVVQGKSQETAARELECSAGIVSNRVREIERIMGMKLGTMKALAAGHEEPAAPVEDSRARGIYRKGLTDDTGLDEEDDY